MNTTTSTERPGLVAWRNRRMFESAARKPANKARYSRKTKYPKGSNP
jgi:hypothetical protein